MNSPEMYTPRSVAEDTTALTAYLPLPGFGVLPVNAFVIDAEQPVLIDTGLSGLREDFMQHLHSVIDPRTLHWIWITHADADHLGNLQAVLSVAPQARIVTTYLGMGKMGLQQIPLDRVYLLNPGQQLDVGDRQLTAVRLPTYDAPETCGAFDPTTRSLFSADCFGALMQAPADRANDMDPEQLKQGCLGWAAVDAPWLRNADPAGFARELDAIASLEAHNIFSAHLPPAHGLTGQLLDYLRDAPRAPAFRGPDQAELQRMMAA
jgi:glyoxylase-like metal-dependent hydrolase (beta-lactamase superfamily II)